MKKANTGGLSSQSGMKHNMAHEAPEPTTLDLPQTIAGVIDVVPGKVSLEEKVRARQALNALQQVQDRSPRPPSGDAVSQSEGPLSAAPSNLRQKRIKIDDILAPALAMIGYKKVAKLTYRGEWSSAYVEHILTLETVGTPKIYLCGDAGLRNPRATAFVNQCRGRYAHPIILRDPYGTAYVDPPWFCPTHFPIGIPISGKLPWRLDMSAYSPSDLAQTLTEAVQSKLVPLVRPIVSTAALLELVERNEEPVLWVRTGACEQAAIVAYLAAALGADRMRTKALLLRNARWLGGWLDEPRVTPESYIDHILDDADIFVAQTAS